MFVITCTQERRLTCRDILSQYEALFSHSILGVRPVDFLVCRWCERRVTECWRSYPI